MTERKLKPLSDDKDLAAVPLDEPVLVELPGAEPAEAEADSVADAKPAAKEPEPKTEPAKPAADDAVARVTKELEAAKAARDKAVKDAADARAEAARHAKELEEARGRAVDSEGDAIASGLAAAMAERDAARGAHKVAFEAGDSDKMAEAAERLGRAAADIREFERAQTALEDRRKRDAETAKTRSEPQPQQFASAEEAIRARADLTTAEQDWLISHQDAWVDPARNAELGVAYRRAMAKNLVRGTPDYFRFIEEFMGYVEPAKPAEERIPPVSAPVSRENQTISGQRQSRTQVYLDSEQRKLIRQMGITDAEYAAGVLEMEQDRSANPQKYVTR